MRNTTHDFANPTPASELITVSERRGAELLDVSPRTFRKLIDQGVIRPIKIPGIRRNVFEVAALRELVAGWKNRQDDPEAA
jgi:hypothetical protein